MFHTSALAFSGFLALFGMCSYMFHPRLGLYLHLVSSLCMCLSVQISSVYKDATHLGLSATLIQEDIISTN